MNEKKQQTQGAAADRLGLVAPVQLAVRCTSCGHERTSLALNPRALDEALRCERCKAANEVLGHRASAGCSCCL